MKNYEHRLKKLLTINKFEPMYMIEIKEGKTLKDAVAEINQKYKVNLKENVVKRWDKFPKSENLYLSPNWNIESFLGEVIYKRKETIRKNFQLNESSKNEIT